MPTSSASAASASCAGSVPAELESAARGAGMGCSVDHVSASCGWLGWLTAKNDRSAAVCVRSGPDPVSKIGAGSRGVGGIGVNGNGAVGWLGVGAAAARLFPRAADHGEGGSGGSGSRGHWLAVAGVT